MTVEEALNYVNEWVSEVDKGTPADVMRTLADAVGRLNDALQTLQAAYNRENELVCWLANERSRLLLGAIKEKP